MKRVEHQLLKELDSLDDSPKFCVSGSVNPVLPGLEVEGVGGVGLPIQATEAKKLIKHASQAPYGRGEETIVDSNVRRVWQIDPAHFALQNPEWGTLLSGILKTIKSEFGINDSIKHGLYKLLIYEKGSFFAPHRDSEKTEGMFATLVICLPSHHEGGALVVNHDERREKVCFAGKKGEFKVQYAAFYADCEHEVKPVKKGYRICLVYNLAFAKKKKTKFTAPKTTEKIKCIQPLLETLFSDPERNKIAVPLKHEYTKVGLQWSALKGKDRSLAQVMAEAGCQFGFQVYLALLTYHQEGEVDYDSICDTSSWGYYNGYDEDVNDSEAEMGEIVEESTALDHWLAPQDQKETFGEMSVDESEVISKKKFTDFPYEQTVHGPTGNEGMSMERWYRQAMLVIWPQSRHFRILANQGQHFAVPALEDLMENSRNPSKSPECYAFAKAIIHHWHKCEVRRYYYYDDPPPTGSSKSLAMLTLLAKMDDPKLVDLFIVVVLRDDFDGTEGQVLYDLCEKFGWETLGAPLTRFLKSQKPPGEAPSLKKLASIVTTLCSPPTKMKPERIKVCKALGLDLKTVVIDWDTKKEEGYSWRSEESREGILECMFTIFSSVKVSDQLDDFLDHTFANSKRYNLRKILIPAAQEIQKWPKKTAIQTKAHRKLIDFCIAELLLLTKEPVEEPKDWVQNITIQCDCEDCEQLQRFLLHPKQQVCYFRVRKDRRRHLHEEIKARRCDLTHVTERKGSPFTLVCTKTRATYERKKKRFEGDLVFLTELEKI